MHSICIRIVMSITILCFAAKVNGQSNPTEIKYTNCNNCWNPDSLGNHRAVINVNSNANWAKVIIPWRRRDTNPQNKRIIIQDAQTNNLITDYKVIHSFRAFGEIHFKPSSGKGNYFIYYMPYKNEGRSNYPKGTYLKPIENSNPDLPTDGEATVTEFQAIDALNSFYPMEVIASESETNDFITKHKAPFIVIPEQREFPIKMTKDLPLDGFKNQ